MRLPTAFLFEAVVFSDHGFFFVDVIDIGARRELV
jgi:hypothetical protein